MRGIETRGRVIGPRVETRTDTTNVWQHMMSRDTTPRMWIGLACISGAARRGMSKSRHEILDLEKCGGVFTVCGERKSVCVRPSTRGL